MKEFKESLIKLISEEIEKTEKLINNCYNSVDKNYYSGMKRGYENILDYLNY